MVLFGFVQICIVHDCPKLLLSAKEIHLKPCVPDFRLFSKEVKYLYSSHNDICNREAYKTATSLEAIVKLNYFISCFACKFLTQKQMKLSEIFQLIVLQIYIFRTDKK